MDSRIRCPYRTQQTFTRSTMRIAVTSQNRRTITAHAGKCRNFLIYDTEGRQVVAKRLVELPIEATFHASHGEFPAVLAGIDLLITASLGEKLHSQLVDRRIRPIVTDIADPDTAVDRLLAGIPIASANPSHQHAH